MTKRAEFFSSLFKALPVAIDDDLFTMEGPSISPQQSIFLSAIPSTFEIKDAVFFSQKK